MTLAVARSSPAAAAILRDDPAAIEHKLYWAGVDTIEEARYLAAILGSEAARRKIEGLQSRGQWGARDFDKVMFTFRSRALTLEMVYILRSPRPGPRPRGSPPRYSYLKE